MAAEVQEPLTKVDSATAEPRRERKSSHVAGVYDMKELLEQKIDPKIAGETQKLNWKINTSPSSIDETENLKKVLTTPPLRVIELRFPLGSSVTARNRTGVTIKDAMEAIYKQYKKKADEDLGSEIYLKGFEWDKEENWTYFKVHRKATGDAPSGGSKKKKGNKSEES